MDLGLAGKVAIVTGARQGGLGDEHGRRGCSRRAAASSPSTATRRERARSSSGSRRSARSPATSATSRRPTSPSRWRPRRGGVRRHRRASSTTPAIYPSHAWDEYSRRGVGRDARHEPALALAPGKATVPHMAARGGGSIVNIGSITFADRDGEHPPVRRVARAGSIGFTRALAREVGAAERPRQHRLARARSRPAARRSTPTPRATAASCSSSRAQAPRHARRPRRTSSRSSPPSAPPSSPAR